MEDAARTERDKLIVRVLADTGLRVDELLGMRTTDLIEQNRNYYLRARGKGAKDRLVPAPRLYRRLRSTSREAAHQMPSVTASFSLTAADRTAGTTSPSLAPVWIR
jgi:integrase